MKVIVLAVSVYVALWFQSVSGVADDFARAENRASASTEVSLEDHFAATVGPVLHSRCQPCHFPGGKMYERLPFDDPATVVEHASPISRRLKDEDLERLRDFESGLRP